MPRLPIFATRTSVAFVPVGFVTDMLVTPLPVRLLEVPGVIVGSIT